MDAEALIDVISQTKPIRKKNNNVDVMVDVEPRKYRMYCFVERHLSPIDKGIQAAHSIVEYSNQYSNNVDYTIWSYSDKTMVLLNGGTVNDLCDICKKLNDYSINYSLFKEQDLGNVITAVAVLVDDRSFNNVNQDEWKEEYFVLSEEEKRVEILRELIYSKHLAR